MLRYILALMILLTPPRAALAQDVLTTLHQPSPFVSDRLDPDSLVGRPAPSVILRSAIGDELSLDTLRGHPILINFWATWCANCSAPIRRLRTLHLPAGAVLLAVDAERDPTLATDFLDKFNISVRNFHDDGSFRRAFHLPGAPYPWTILIAPDGHIVYSHRAIFHEELKAALATLAPATSYVEDTQVPAADLPGLRTLTRQVLTTQSTFMGKPESMGKPGSKGQYVCRYHVILRDSYGGGRSTSNVEATEEVLATPGEPLHARLVDPTSNAQTLPDPKSIAPSFAVWTSPILSAVFEHSILSNITHVNGQPRDDGSDDGSAEEYVSFTVRGDPAYKPANDTERIAQALEGSITVSLNSHLLVAIDLVAAYDAVDHDSLLMRRSIPAITFHAVPFEGIHLPGEWSIARFQPVPGGRYAARAWDATLARIFGTRDSCQLFDPGSRILPGSRPAQPEP